jgi:hypothetical protein
LLRKESASWVRATGAGFVSLCWGTARSLSLLLRDLPAINKLAFPNSEGTMERHLYKSMGIQSLIHTSHHLRRKLAFLSNRRPINIKQIRNWNQRCSNETKNTARPRYAQIMEHRVHEEREGCREHGAQKCIGSYG